MSERLHTATDAGRRIFRQPSIYRAFNSPRVIAVVSLVLCLVGAFVNPHQFSYSWLFAFVFFFTLCAGCFFWTIVHHATDANWSVVVRRQLENIAVLLGVLAVLLFQSCCCAAISTRGWTFRRGMKRTLIPSARISIFIGSSFARLSFWFLDCCVTIAAAIFRAPG
jgi:hypothetical protein